MAAEPTTREQPKAEAPEKCYVFGRICRGLAVICRDVRRVEMLISRVRELVEEPTPRLPRCVHR